MTEEWFEARPICFGRYVADVPKILQPVIIGTLLEGFTVTNLGRATQRELDAKIADRQGLMKAGAEIDNNALPTKHLYTRRDKNLTVLGYERPR